MSDIRTEGQGNVPEHPMLVLPNRVDMTVLTELEKALGGPGRVAWMVEESLLPSSDIMQHLRQTRAAGLLCSADRQGREAVAERVRAMLAQGRHVVLLTGHPAQSPAAVTDVPARQLSLFDGTGLPALPVYVGMLRKDGAALTVSAAPYDTLVLRLLPVVRASASLGVTVLTAWMEAAADTLMHHPQLEKASLPQALVRAMLAHPNARLIDGVDDTSVTYRELLAVAVMLAGVLKKHSSHKRIGVILPPGKLCTVANLACWLCGMVPVNIDYLAEAADFRRCTETAGLTRFITEERFVAKQSTFAWPPPRDLIYIDRELREMGPGRIRFNAFLLRAVPAARVLAHLDLPAPAPEDEAALFFTGGVSGTPKAAPLTHRMLLTNALQMHQCLQTAAGETVLSVLPLCRPQGLTQGLLLPLLAGCDIVTYPSLRAPKRLCALMSRYGVKLAMLPPSLVRSLLSVAEKGTFASLRHFLTVGEKLPVDLAARAANEFNLALYESYCLTEASPLAALNLPTPAVPAGQAVLPANKPGSVGLPLPGVAVRITDPYRSDLVLPPDTPGLLWLKGPSLLRAYLDDEAATMSRVHGGWFCTGDIARLSADGMLSIAGRKTRYSKIGGEMVPHETLEQVLLKVLKADPSRSKRLLAVVGVPDRTQGERLILLSTLHRIMHPNDLIAIRYGIMNEGYPSLWCPERIVPVKSIPVLPDGRLNYPLCFEGACRAAGVTQ
ncbi:MAG: AMP-binding protein [Akkermansia sp.]|nr:AMP-binding protein [Akkermansia sp.]